MTHNQIERSKAEETERSNRAKEALEKRGQNLKLGGDIFKTVSKIGSVFKNDKSFYNMDPNMVRDSARISFHTPLSAKLPINDTVKFGATGAAVVTTANTAMGNIPSIMRFGIAPVYGQAGDELSALTIAARGLFAQIRKANAGAKNYEANDLMFYLMALDSLSIIYNWGCHLYSVMRTAKSEDWAYPTGMIRALGFKASDFFGQNSVTPNDVRAYLNQMAIALRPFSFPATMPIFARHAELVRGEFKDYEVTKSQVYVFTPVMLWKYNEFVTPGRMDQVPIFTTADQLKNGITWLQYKTLFNSLYSTLIQSEDIATMSGDIRKAFENDLLVWEQISEDYHVESVFNPEVLNQIQNATISGLDFSANAMPTGYSSQVFHTIEEGTSGEIVYKSYFWGRNASGSGLAKSSVGLLSKFTSMKDSALRLQVRRAFGAGDGTLMPLGLEHRDILFSMYKDNPDPDDIMVSSRLTLTIELRPQRLDYQDTTYSDATKMACFGEVTSMGSEIVTFALIYEGADGSIPTNVDGNDLLPLTLSDGEIIDAGSGASNLVQALRATNIIVKNWSRFDWAPRLRIQIREIDENNSSTVTSVVDSFEVANVATLDSSILGNLHRTAIYSLFAIPKLSRT